MINKIKNSGFTLVETLIAVLILVTAVAGPLTIAAKGLSTALIAKDQIIAYYLAQDAMEFVRAARDTNRLQSGDWITGAGGLDSSKVINLAPGGTGCIGPNGCNIDSSAGTVSGCSTAPCATQGNMKFNTTTRFYSTSGTVLPIFTRIIKITTPANGGSREKTVTITVAWTDVAGVTHPPITIKEAIFNWQ